MDNLSLTVDGTQCNVDATESSNPLFQIMGTLFITALAAVGITGNILILVVIPRIPDDSMGEASKVFFKALSIVDLLTALNLINILIFKVYPSWVIEGPGNVHCKIVALVDTFASGSSGCFLFATNLDRFIQVTRPYTYQSIVTTKRAIAVVISTGVLVFSSVVGILGGSGEWLRLVKYIPKNEICFIDFSNRNILPFVVAMFTTAIWLPCVLLVAMYARILHIVRTHARKINAQQSAAVRLTAGSRFERIPTVSNNRTTTSSSGISSCSTELTSVETEVKTLDSRSKTLKLKVNNFARILQTLRTPLVITTCYMAAWIPLSVFLTASSAMGTPIGGDILKVTASLAVANCSINIFVYVMTRRDFKQAMRHFICRR